MKKNYPRYLLLLSQICLSIVLIAQEDDPFPIQVPDLDTLHFPVWPGCYRSDLSEQAQYLCTCKQMAALIYPHVNWPEESLIDSGYLKIMIYVNRDGTIGPIQLFRKTNHWLDAEVLKTMHKVVPPLGWRPAYLYGQPVHAVFVAWIKYKPGDTNGEKVVLTSLAQSEYLRGGSEIFYPREYTPYFLDGMEALWKFFNDHVQMPAISRDDIQGSQLAIQFVVERNGKVSSPKVIKSIHPEIDEAYLRAFEKMPKWMPGRRSGRIVKWQMILPIRIHWQ